MVLKFELDEGKGSIFYPESIPIPQEYVISVTY